MQRTHARGRATFDGRSLECGARFGGQSVGRGALATGVELGRAAPLRRRSLVRELDYEALGSTGCIAVGSMGRPRNYLLLGRALFRSENRSSVWVAV